MHDRLNKLELVYRRPDGCDTCRAWDGTVIADERRGPRTYHRPETCPACGRTVPYTRVVLLAGDVAVSDI